MIFHQPKNSTANEQFNFSIDTDNVMKLVLLSLCFWLHCVLEISADVKDSRGLREDSTWKWHVQLLNAQLTEQALSCGGTLLNKLFVTTAAHCLYDLNGDPLNIEQLRILLADGEYRSIRRTLQPKPFYVENISNDFVLLLLDREVRYNNLVAPICLPKPNEILPQDIHTPLLSSGPRSLNSEDICLSDANILFGMTYMDAICLGTFDLSHKYHRNAGSGMFVERRSKWYLVGLVMYTTGPSKVHINYIGGIRLESYLAWIKTTLDHYSEAPSIIEKKCQAYMRVSNLPFKEYHPIVNLVDANSPRTICRGALISSRFVLTTERCAVETKRVFIHYGNHSSDWFVHKRDHIEPIDERIALIELDRDVKTTVNVLACLYSSISRQNSVNYTTRIAHVDSFVRLEGIRVQYQINRPLRVLYYCSRYQNNGHFTSPGDLLVFKNQNERFYRVMGILEDELGCKSFDYFNEREKAVQAINVEIYLPWIEEVVWGGK